MDYFLYKLNSERGYTKG